MISLSSKIHYFSDILETDYKHTVKGIQKGGNDIIYQIFNDVSLNGIKILY